MSRVHPIRIGPLVGLTLVATLTPPLTTESAPTQFLRAATCHAAQIHETLVTHEPSTNFDAYDGWLYFTNVAKDCKLRVAYVGIEAVAAPGRTILSTSAVPTVAIAGTIDLRHGQSARAEVGFGRTTGFPQCQAKWATGFEVLPLVASWPRRYFALSQRELVCTGASISISAGLLVRG